MRPEVFRVPTDPGRPWQVRVVPNRYSVVAPADRADGDAAATGTHEVVVESWQHDGDLGFADAEQTARVLWAIRERCRALEGGGSAAVVVFDNHGAAADESWMLRRSTYRYHPT
jgi:UDPglucose--hexose-1-phosphate uridylyltransferase